MTIPAHHRNSPTRCFPRQQWLSADLDWVLPKCAHGTTCILAYTHVYVRTVHAPYSHTITHAPGIWSTFPILRTVKHSRGGSLRLFEAKGKSNDPLESMIEVITGLWETTKCGSEPMVVHIEQDTGKITYIDSQEATDGGNFIWIRAKNERAGQLAVYVDGTYWRLSVRDSTDDRLVFKNKKYSTYRKKQGGWYTTYKYGGGDLRKEKTMIYSRCM